MRAVVAAIAAAVALLPAACRKAEDPKGKPERGPEVLKRGRAVYDVHCAKCHGPEGRGDGPSAGLAVPKPRDFTRRQFRYVSTESRLPREEDLFRVVTKGSPGTQMLAFEPALTEYERWAAVYHVEALAGLGADGRAAYAVPAPPAPARDDARLGAQLYDKHCSKCHGDRGHGDGVVAGTLRDERGDPVPPRNLAKDPLRGGEAAEQIFLRLKLGLPGTPMEPPTGYPELTDDEAWLLVRHIQSLRGGGPKP